MNYSRVQQRHIQRQSPTPRRLCGTNLQTMWGMLFFQKELKKFIRESNPSFFDLREEALCWSEEEERPQRSRSRPPLSQEVSADTPESSQCSACFINTPMDKVLDILLKQQKSLELRSLRTPQGKPHPDKSPNLPPPLPQGAK